MLIINLSSFLLTTMTKT